MDLEALKIRALESLSAGELDDLVHEAKSQEAAAINNSGVADQVEYLIESFGGVNVLWNQFKGLLAKSDFRDYDDSKYTCPNCQKLLLGEDLSAGQCLSCLVDLEKDKF